MRKLKFSRVVILLSLVSLLTDVSSEMLYPVMPLYLQTIGFSAVWIGFLEGFAQVMIGFSTGYFGKLSDQTGARMPFVRIGYTLSALAKPMMIFWSSIGWVFFSRVSERLGKGIRTSARGAGESFRFSQSDGYIRCCNRSFNCARILDHSSRWLQIFIYNRFCSRNPRCSSNFFYKRK